MTGGIFTTDKLTDKLTDKPAERVAIIGSTGSIGKTALAVVKRLGIRVTALTAHSNLELLQQQVAEFSPDIVGVTDPAKEQQARQLFGKKLVTGKDALTIPAEITGGSAADTVLVSVVGISGIHSVLAAIKSGKRVALANKESLVAGGEIVTNALKNAKNAQLLPVDSEHSAVFQCLKSGSQKQIEKIVLTASGGAFYNFTQEQLKTITPKDIRHPNWSMGRKITVDSNTMMNKTLEIIEAYWLFATDRIDYCVHPQSIIHSMVNFCDGSTIAQIAQPDMSLPIQYALSYPHRAACLSSFGFDKPLTFLPKNPLFFAPDLAKQVMEKGKNSGAILNAANEAAVELFESGKIGFLDIVQTVKNCLDSSQLFDINSAEDLLSVHNEVMQRVRTDYNILRRN